MSATDFKLGARRTPVFVTLFGQNSLNDEYDQEMLQSQIGAAVV